MFAQKEDVVNSIIGENSYFSGKLTIQGSLRIEGCYEGESITVDHISVGKKGRVKSDVHANSIVVEGVVIGSIYAKNRVFLMPTSHVLGKIHTPELIIQNGVMLDGHCIVSPDFDNNAKETIEAEYIKQKAEF